MPESDETHENIAYIRTHVDNLERMVRFQIKSDPESRATVLAVFADREKSADLYLHLEAGPQSQSALACKLKVSIATASRITGHLYQAGLITKVPDPNDSKQSLYVWSDLEQLVGVARLARKHLQSNSKKPTR